MQPQRPIRVIPEGCVLEDGAACASKASLSSTSVNSITCKPGVQANVGLPGDTKL